MMRGKAPITKQRKTSKAKYRHLFTQLKKPIAFLCPAVPHKIFVKNSKNLVSGVYAFNRNMITLQSASRDNIRLVMKITTAPGFIAYNHFTRQRSNKIPFKRSSCFLN